MRKCCHPKLQQFNPRFDRQRLFRKLSQRLSKSLQPPHLPLCLWQKPTNRSPFARSSARNGVLIRPVKLIRPAWRSINPSLPLRLFPQPTNKEPSARCASRSRGHCPRFMHLRQIQSCRSTATMIGKSKRSGEKKLSPCNPPEAIWNHLSLIRSSSFPATFSPSLALFVFTTMSFKSISLRRA